MRRNVLLLVFVLLASVVAYENHRRDREEQRMELIQRLGGFVDQGGAFIVLGGRDVTDRNIDDLAVFPELEYLALPETAVTHEGIDRLRQFNLVGLEVLRTHVDAPFYVKVSGLPKLRILKMSQTGTTDNCLVTLSHLPGLEVLDLSYCPISTDGVRHLVMLQNLRVLDLHATRIGDECLVELRKLPRLERVDIARTKVTLQGVRELHAAVPACQITY